MAEDFALKGVESNPAQQADSVNEALFSDAYNSSKCLGGGPGVKCGAPRELPPIEMPTVISSESPSSAELPVMRGPMNGYPGVFYDLGSIFTDRQPRSYKEAEKQRVASIDQKEPLEKENPNQKEKPELKEVPELKEKQEPKDIQKPLSINPLEATNNVEKVLDDPKIGIVKVATKIAEQWNRP